MDEQTFDQQFKGKSGTENFMALAKSLEAGTGQPTAVEQPGAAMAAFDADMQRAGIQQPTGSDSSAVDQAAYDFLQNAYKTTPAEKRDTRWKMTWENDLRTVLEGRRMGESVAAFDKRRRSDAKPAAAEEDPYVAASALTEAQRAGYTIPEAYRGYEFDTGALAAARAAGVTQSQFEAFCRRMAGP